MKNIHQLIYVSAGRKDVTAETLDSILSAARANNAKADVTGLLLFHDGSFFQVLEGSEASVTGVFSNIAADKRHSGVIVLQSQATDRRSFPGWSMGFMGAHAMRPDQKAHLIDLRKLAATGQPQSLSATPAVDGHINAFLASFREFADF